MDWGDEFSGRKELALSTEREVRRGVLEILRHHTGENALQAVEPAAESRKQAASLRSSSGEKWT